LNREEKIFVEIKERKSNNEERYTTLATADPAVVYSGVEAYTIEAQ